VTINDDLPIDKSIEHIGGHPDTERPYTRISLYCTKNENPIYCDDEGVDLIGEVKIAKSKEGQDGQKHKIIKKLFFGDTELLLNITDEATGVTYQERFDFLISED